MADVQIENWLKDSGIQHLLQVSTLNGIDLIATF